MTSTHTALHITEPELLAAAKRGDADAFARLVSPYRGELHAHCYRMLGSVSDAEDALQDALLRAWRGLPRFEGRSSLRSWLYTIATNVCLRAIERRPKRVLPIDYGPAADPHDTPTGPLLEYPWLEPYPDERLGVEDGFAGPEASYQQRESIELAFIALLQHVPARQRAVLLLRDVLGFSAQDVAEVLDTTPTSVHSALQRAHKTVEERRPEQSQQVVLRSLGEARLAEIVNKYVSAWERGDVDAVVAMLAEDVRLAMPPIPTWYDGRDAAGTFLEHCAFTEDRPWRIVPLRASAQLSFGHYRWDPDKGDFAPHDVTVLTLRGEQIHDITFFIGEDVLRRFGLPDRPLGSHH